MMISNKPLKKTRTFLLKRSESTAPQSQPQPQPQSQSQSQTQSQHRSESTAPQSQPQPQPQSQSQSQSQSQHQSRSQTQSQPQSQPTKLDNIVPRNNMSPLLEFPTSPQLIFGEEIRQFGHPQHPLSQVILPDLFTCDGCKEYGAGKRFICQQCDFQLHDFCALAPPALKNHPFHFQHQLVFYSKAGGIAQSKCDVCHRPSKGYAFRCSVCSFQMHPCCAMLSSEINLQTHPHTLRLLPAAASGSSGGDSSGISFVCAECRRKRSGRVYHCKVCDYHIHAVCAKNMINGLQENGLKGREKPSVLGTAARLASQVVIGFIGGLIEGLGEGVAEVFVQNIARSGRPNAPN